MPRTVMWPSAPGQGGAQLILPHATHPQPTPLILDNRLVTLSAPTQGPLSPSGGDKQGHSSAGQPTTLVKLEDSPMTGGYNNQLCKVKKLIQAFLCFQTVNNHIFHCRKDFLFNINTCFIL